MKLAGVGDGYAPLSKELFENGGNFWICTLLVLRPYRKSSLQVT